MYFCYLSRNKINDIYANLHEHTIISEKKIKTKENNFDTEASGKVKIPFVSDFIGKIAYGHKGVSQYETEQKQTYANKLKYILNNIYPIGDIILSLETKTKINNGYYYYEGDFYVKDAIFDFNNSNVITIESKVYIDENEYTLFLDCSIKNFSEITADGSYELHSSNYGFFTRKFRVFFSCVFLLINIESYTINGSPLYLLLTDDQILM